MSCFSFAPHDTWYEILREAMRGCGVVRHSRTHTQQRKMADERYILNIKSKKGSVSMKSLIDEPFHKAAISRIIWLQLHTVSKVRRGHSHYQYDKQWLRKGPYITFWPAPNSKPRDLCLTVIAWCIKVLHFTFTRHLPLETCDSLLLYASLPMQSSTPCNQPHPPTGYPKSTYCIVYVSLLFSEGIYPMKQQRESNKQTVSKKISVTQ